MSKRKKESVRFDVELAVTDEDGDEHTVRSEHVSVENARGWVLAHATITKVVTSEVTNAE